jgi:hypothetical protein
MRNEIAGDVQQRDDDHSKDQPVDRPCERDQHRIPLTAAAYVSSTDGL